MTATHITAPDGSLWQLVPVEPTPKMIDATWNHEIETNGGIESNNARNRRVYTAMLAAAPELGGVAEPLAWVSYTDPRAPICLRVCTDVFRRGLEVYSDGPVFEGEIPLTITHPPAADEPSLCNTHGSAHVDGCAKCDADIVAMIDAMPTVEPPAADEAMGRDVDVSFTADEVNECFDVLIDKGPRLIPEEIIEEMRGYLLEAAAHGMPAAAMRGGESGE